MWKLGVALLLSVCIVGACSSSDKTTITPSTSGTGAVTIGTAGGTVTSSDGNLSVVIPAGALAANTTIAITTATPSTQGFIGRAYEIEPEGTTFKTPITITIEYDASFGDPSALALGTFAGSSWVALTSTSDGKTVSAETPHLSQYAVVDKCAAACPSGTQCEIDNEEKTACIQCPTSCTGAEGTACGGGTCRNGCCDPAGVDLCSLVQCPTGQSCLFNALKQPYCGVASTSDGGTCDPACPVGYTCQPDLDNHYSCVSGGPTDLGCAASCAQGCCDDEGICHPDGTTNASFCGTKGITCVTCQTSATCKAGSCLLQ